MVISRLLLLILLSGCLSSSAPDGVPSSPSTQPPAAPESLALEVLIADYPKIAFPDEPVMVSWRILADSKVKINNTTVRYGYTSIKRSLGGGDAPGDAGYPLSTEKLLMGKLEAPGSFFSEFTPTHAGAIFFRVHALVDDKNYWSKEYKIEVTQKPSLRLLSTPMRAVSGEELVASWEVTTPFDPVSFSTRVYYGAASRQVSADSSPPAGYPTSTATYSVAEKKPINSFQAIVVPNVEGSLFIRAYAEIDGRDYWSDEREILIKKRLEVVLLSYPEKGNVSSLYAFQWRVVGGDPGIIEETSVVWGPKKGQKKGDYTFTGTLQKGSTPKNFQDSFYIGYGGVFLYFRVYAVVDGVYHYSEEHRIHAEDTGSGGY